MSNCAKTKRKKLHNSNNYVVFFMSCFKQITPHQQDYELNKKHFYCPPVKRVPNMAKILNERKRDTYQKQGW